MEKERLSIAAALALLSQYIAGNLLFVECDDELGRLEWLEDQVQLLRDEIANQQ